MAGTGGRGGGGGGGGRGGVGGAAIGSLTPPLPTRVPKWGPGVLGFARRGPQNPPLAVLEAVKNLDTPVEDGLSEFAEELLSKRLGLSDTVAMQLREYEGMVRRGAPADRAHVQGVVGLGGGRARSGPGIPGARPRA